MTEKQIYSLFKQKENTDFEVILLKSVNRLIINPYYA